MELNRRLWICLLVLPLVAVSCTQRPVSRSRTAPVPDPPRPSVSTCPEPRVETFHLEIPAFSPLSDFELRPRYVERMQLHDRTLERQRYKVMISGEKNWKEHFYLAVLLWRLADVEESALQVPPPKDAPATDVLEYRRKLRSIQNYRQESLLHLEYLYHLPGVSAPALERFAYYSAHVQGAAAIPYFYKLMEHPKVPDARYYVVDFASLLLSDGRCSEAAAVLSRGFPEEHAPRAAIVQALVQICRPPVALDAFRTLCSRIPEGVWHDFIPVLARAFWLSGFSDAVPEERLKATCPELAADSARRAHFAHVYADLAQSWKFPSPVVEKADFSDSKILVRKLEPLLKFAASLAAFWASKSPVMQLRLDAQGWHWQASGTALPQELVQRVLSRLPAVPGPASSGDCPFRFLWELHPAVGDSSSSGPPK